MMLQFVLHLDGDAMRRGKGEGSVYQRKSDGLYVAALPSESGRRGKTFTARTKSRALEKRAAYVTAHARGQILQGKSTRGTLLAYLLVWVEEHPVAESSRRSYRGHISNQIGPSSIGHRKLAALEPQHVKAFLADLARDGVSKPTVVRIRATLSKALNCAVDANLIPYNPCTRAKAPPAPSGKRAHKPLREEDISLFGGGPLLASVGSAVGNGDAVGRGPQGALGGCQPGRRVGARPGRQDGDERPGDPPARLDAGALTEHQKACERKRGLVFMTEARGRWEGGKQLDPRNVNRRHHKLLDLAGIEDRRVHDLRHTFLTTVLAETGDLQLVSELGGHADISITSKFYVSGSSKARSLPSDLSTAG
jgi:site-specific recombinase XerD